MPLLLIFREKFDHLIKMYNIMAVFLLAYFCNQYVIDYINMLLYIYMHMYIV